MILGNTQIAGDLRIADNKAIYVSGKVNVPELAILESDPVTPNRSVVFSINDTKPDTIKTTNTEIKGNTISPKLKSEIKTASSLNIMMKSKELSISGKVKTKDADQSLVTVCRKRNVTAPTWGANDRVLVSGDICYIYSKSQKLSEYDLSTNQFVFLPKGSFTADTSQATSGHIFKLITDPTFSLA